ncbi:cytidine deaminase [Candidatus Ruminimicrobiellum ovillum]|uniref:cytidine deaminase n=1 Tax=Candidatus Ruminimicrobiellum ovillum TaxID=1947927 RepID=UPI00355AA896
MNKKQAYKQLLEFAKQTAGNSYSPYSKFAVGAAVLCENNKVFCGTNVENASYGLSMCAERVAVFTAVANGCKKIKAIAIYSEKGNVTPCGACRQVLSEFSKTADVVYNTGKNSFKTVKISSLLPKSFSGKTLKK